MFLFMAVSGNGWSVVGSDRIKTYRVAGRPIPLRKGPAGELLIRLAEEFNDKVEPVQQGRDDWGYAVRQVTGGSYYSNHASGTAMDLNATQHPYGRRGTFTKKQHRRIKRLLRKYRHAIRWGGEYADEMHFEINTGEQEVIRTLRKVRKRHVRVLHLHRLRRGKMNKEVLALKRRMRSRGLLRNGAVHPIFGSNLTKDIMAYQRRKGRKRPDGQVHPEFLRELGFKVRR